MSAEEWAWLRVRARRNPIDGSANVQPLEQRGLPAWAYTPLTGLILEGLGGAVRASFLSR